MTAVHKITEKLLKLHKEDGHIVARVEERMVEADKLREALHQYEAETEELWQQGVRVRTAIVRVEKKGGIT